MTKPVCLITGASSGIGKGLALAFIAADYQVLGLDIQAATIEEKNFHSLQADITDPQAVKLAVEQATQLGQLEVLINNAGMQFIAPIEEFPYEKWQKVIELNLSSCFLLASECFSAMKENTQLSSIINIGSIHSKEASANKAAYIAAKHGLLGLTRSLAVEGANFGIKANLIGPGFVKTPLVSKQIPELAQQKGISEEQVVKQIMLQKTLDGEFTTVEEIAQTALFFAKFPSLALSGQSLLVSHGQNLV
jgi:3-hydroxybutyrate dehydrogenase